MSSFDPTVRTLLCEYFQSIRDDGGYSGEDCWAISCRLMLLSHGTLVQGAGGKKSGTIGSNSLQIIMTNISVPTASVSHSCMSLITLKWCDFYM